MTENDFRYIFNIYKEEKGINAENVSDKKHIVNTINMLLCHLKQEDISDVIVGLKIAVERLEIDDVCHIWIDTDSDYKVRLFYTPLYLQEKDDVNYCSDEEDCSKMSEEEIKSGLEKNKVVTIPVTLAKRLYAESVQHNWLAQSIGFANNEEDCPCLVSVTDKMEKFEGCINAEKNLHLSILTDVATNAYVDLQEYGEF